jgi:hypothetical protein
VCRRFAPLVLFHKYEGHLPEDPENFKAGARFRESNYQGFADRIYNENEGWTEVDGSTPAYFDIPWGSIQEECQKRFEGENIDPTVSRNLRPRDGNNRYGEGSARGLFLERDERLGQEKSGYPVASHRVTAPVFLDTAYDEDAGIVKVLFWFFYALNWWKFLITHEGDWEHITLFFTDDAFAAGGAPFVVYFAQHNAGIPLAFENLQVLETDGGNHPILFIDRNGHPCNPVMEHPHKYSIRWETWKGEITPISEKNWSEFAGAWGRAGLFAFSTGPLGPLFKRHGDDVRVVYKNGRPYVKIPKTWRFTS